MIRVMLDGKKMFNKILVHKYIKWKLKAPDYCGNNLDALWDVLSTRDRLIEITLINTEDLIRHLGDYGESLIDVFRDAEEDNENICLRLYDKKEFKY